MSESTVVIDKRLLSDTTEHVTDYNDCLSLLDKYRTFLSVIKVCVHCKCDQLLTQTSDDQNKLYETFNALENDYRDLIDKRDNVREKKRPNTEPNADSSVSDSKRTKLDCSEKICEQPVVDNSVANNCNDDNSVRTETTETVMTDNEYVSSIQLRVGQIIGYVCRWPQCHQFERKRTTIYAHVNTHTDNKSFKCQLCDSMFGSFKELYRHKITHKN